MIMRKMPQIKIGNPYKWLASMRISKYIAIDFTLVVLATLLFNEIKIETKELYKNHQECLLINGAEAKWLCDSIAYPKSRDQQIREAEQDYNESRKSFPDELITKPREENKNISDDKKNRDFTEQQNKSYKEQEIKRICLEIRKNSQNDMSLILSHELLSNFNVHLGDCIRYLQKFKKRL